MRNLFVKNAFALFVAAIFIFYTAGIYFFYNYDVEKAKGEALKKVKDAEELVELKIPVHEIIWIDKHEFSWKGGMYDVDDYIIDNDTLKCLAYHDHKEKDIHDSFISLMDETHKPESDNSGNAKYKHKTDFIACYSFSSPPRFINLEYSYYFNASYDTYVDVIKPPPRS